MQCIQTKPSFTKFTGILNALALTLLLGGILLGPLLILHLAVMALFNITTFNSFLVGFYISLGLLYVLLPIKLYTTIMKSHNNVSYQFCDNGFFVNEKEYEYKDIENIEVQTSLRQQIYSLSTLVITSRENDQNKVVFIKDIKTPEMFINKIACPINYETLLPH